MLTAVSLFSGVGGFDLVLERNGVKIVATCEIDKHAQGVLTRHFPMTKLFTDVTTLTGKDLLDAGFNPTNGIITGGFPCQDVSVAGTHPAASHPWPVGQLSSGIRHRRPWPAWAAARTPRARPAM